MRLQEGGLSGCPFCLAAGGAWIMDFTRAHLGRPRGCHPGANPV